VAVCLFAPRGFYEYYQINRSHEDDEADEFEPRIKKESKTRVEGSHSLFGILWSIQKETGWTQKYLLWGESWLSLQLKLADAPRTVKGEKSRLIENDDEMIEMMQNL